MDPWEFMFVIGEEYSLTCILLLINYLILFSVLTSFDMCVHQNVNFWILSFLHSCGSRRTVPNGVVNCPTKLKYRNVTPAKCTKGLPDGVYSNGNGINLWRLLVPYVIGSLLVVWLVGFVRPNRRNLGFSVQ